ncbi:MAG: DUF4097 domain-containing protein [Intrasporangium sp.]|uniref:DUF4097 family beta strand repeat-containing protein n=1 Tax=Intrasporangium sp. TaxID=1925024 RepID=UPI0026480BB7|nr:DUF4097 family beta strand repeat-containing protein [Intrasporangium sp.]MDN5796535.1 DUF4097 domain-containing protein [Intrasporangium sp.]
MSSVDQQQTYRADLTGLSFRGASGDLRVVSGAAPGTMEVTRHVRWGMMHSQPKADEKVNGRTLEIDSQCSGFLSPCSVDYQVTVPEGASVTVDVDSGDVALTGTLGAVQTKTGSGDIDASGLTATNTVLRTGSGDLDLSFAVAPGAVDLETGSGGVTMAVPTGDAYRVDVSTGSGDEDVNLDTSQSSSRTIQVRTGSGDVTLEYR